MNRSGLLLPLLLLVVFVPLAQADDFFEGMKPGLIGIYNDAAREYSRVDADVAFDWGSAAPVPQIAPGGFTARWTGVLLARGGTTYQFHAHGQGEVAVTVDGNEVLRGSTTETGWVQGSETPLEFGFLPLEVTFHKTTPDASVKLYWSSDAFPLEPLPYHLLFHADDDSAQRLIEEGRILFDAHRCSRCHTRGDVPVAPEGPPLIAVAADINPDWIDQKLLHAHAGKEHDKMPSFGFNEEEANALGAWLWQINAPPRIAALREPNGEEELPDGLTLVRSVGCLACHTLQGLGQSGPYGGGDLTQIGAKRTVEWIYTWLGQPERMDPNHRMPLVKLTPTERGQIARGLSAIAFTEDLSFHRPAQADNTRHVDHGEELMKRSRCFNCHKVPAFEIDLRGLPTLDRPVQDWSRSCLAENADPTTGRPCYPQADRNALRAYVTFLTNSPVQIVPPPLERVDDAIAASPVSPITTLSPYDFGRLTLERRNCLACHERPGAAGLVPAVSAIADNDPHLRGQTESLLPPNLTAVGDKYLDAPLAEALAGEMKSPRMPWLKVRMPKFRHTDAERAALSHYFISHDRIPPSDPAATEVPIEPSPSGRGQGEGDSSGLGQGEGVPSESALNADVDDQTLLTGQQLAGTGGFSCIACHSVGDYEPRNTALATRGSDLKGMPARMREEFFHRWCRSPLRVTPGVEMPEYVKTVPGAPGDSVQEQMAILWQALGDARFEAPTNPAQVEDLRSLQPGDPPEIIRDVCRVSDANGGEFVARSFAMGFDNGHSILFDLDHACVRDWTFGDFARQRAEGKSWYWELAGTPLVSGLKPECEFVLKRGDEWIRFEGPVDHPGSGLAIVNATDTELHFSYLLPFPDEESRRVYVEERWISRYSPLGLHRRQLERYVRAGIRDGLNRVPESLWIVPNTGTSQFLNAVIGADAAWTQCGEFGLGIGIEGGIELQYCADQVDHSGRDVALGESPASTHAVTTVPGFAGQRLPVDPRIMPLSLAFKEDGTLGITSLRGEVILISDTDGDGTPENDATIASGLATPFGILPEALTDPRRNVNSGMIEPASQSRYWPPRHTWLVVHKPELLGLVGGGQKDAFGSQEVIASGWGYTEDYHDWSTGPVRDQFRNLYIATSSDYAQPGRSAKQSRWRGKVLQIDPHAQVTPIAHELRYPMGISLDPQGRLFVSDQQGVANCYNEINHIVEGARYGVKGLTDPESDQPEKRAAVQLPHPFTRSVNGIFFIPHDIESLAPFAGHGIGCEYNGRFLIRFSLQEVGGELQGAMYLFSRNTWENDAENFLGPICGAIAPNGDLYIGSIRDSGWLGGNNTGDIVRLHREGEFPNGIRELRATPNGFEIEFLRPIDPAAATEPGNYAITGATRVWQGSYATEDSGQYAPAILAANLSDDARTVRLQIDRLEPSYVYEVTVTGKVTPEEQPLFPATGYYTMNRVPTE
jgi:mono/diheme cytochrome c family protein